MEVDPLEKEIVEFQQTGKPQYDEFFLSTAKVRAALVVSNKFAEVMTGNIKGYLHDRIAVQALDKMSEEELFKSLTQVAKEDAKEKGDAIRAEARAKLVKSAASAAGLGVYLVAAAGETVKLISTGKDLSQKVPTDFVGMDAPKAPSVVQGLTGSVNNLVEAGKTLPEVAKRITRLGMGLKAALE